MAKAEKMNRGVSSKTKHTGGNDIKLPPGIHSLDSHGNIFASLPEISRVAPKYFTFDEVKTAVDTGRLTSFSKENVAQLEGLISRK